MKKVLYVGLEVPAHLQGKGVDHFPLIEIRPRSITDPLIEKVFSNLSSYTHLIFTSKSAVDILFRYCKGYKCNLNAALAIAVGSSTAAAIRSQSKMEVVIAQNETAEGVIEMLAPLDLTGARILWPHSALSRLLIAEYLRSRCVNFDACIFYDTYTRTPEVLPDMDHYEEVIFTSPSTVKAFVEVFGSLPEGKSLTPIGPITRKAMESFKEDQANLSHKLSLKSSL